MKTTFFRCLNCK